MYRFFYATNRAPANAEGPVEEKFDSERGESLSFGSFDTRIEPTLGLGMLINPSDWFLNEEIQLKDLRVLELIIRDVKPDRLWLMANSMGGQVVVDAFHLLYQDQDPDFADSQTEIEDVVLTAVTNEGPHSMAVVSYRKEALSSEPSQVEPLGLSWPRGVVSLSHVALPFPPDDPLYGQSPLEDDDLVFLGDMAIRGERGLLRLSADWLLRLRYNPGYPYLQTRVLQWLGVAAERTRSTLR